MLPSFLIIGTMKGGTTSLFYYLDEHPEIRMASMRESDFFIARRNYSRGLDWYAALFGEDDGPRAFGESSPNYTKRQIFPGVAERMHDAVPDARLIYCLRDPIDRIVSHWVHNVSVGRERRDLNEALMDPAESNYVDTSRYHFQIQDYLRFFDEASILYVDSKALRSDRPATLRRAFAFVGVDPDYRSDAFDELHHVSASKERPAPIDRFLPGVRLRKWLRPRLPAALGQPTPIDVPELRSDVRSRLQDVLRPEADAIRSLSGLPLSHWSV